MKSIQVLGHGLIRLVILTDSILNSTKATRCRDIILIASDGVQKLLLLVKELGILRLNGMGVEVEARVFG